MSSSTTSCLAPTQAIEFAAARAAALGIEAVVEDEMLKLGPIFSKKANWAAHVVSCGQLTTGQNPHSSGPAARTLMEAVRQKAKPAVTSRAS